GGIEKGDYLCYRSHASSAVSWPCDTWHLIIKEQSIKRPPLIVDGGKGARVDLLSSILSAISKRVNQQSFSTWFKPISQASQDQSTVYLKVPNEIFRDWISNNYFDVLEEALEELGLSDHKIGFLIEDKQAAAAAAAGRASEARNRPPKPISFISTQQIGNFAYARLAESEAPELSLNPKYTFDTFVVGSSNEFAAAAAKA